MTDDERRQAAWARVGRRLMVDELQRAAEQPHEALHAAAQAIREDRVDEGDLREAELALAAAGASVALLRAVVGGSEGEELAVECRRY